MFITSVIFSTPVSHIHYHNLKQTGLKDCLPKKTKKTWGVRPWLSTLPFSSPEPLSIWSAPRIMTYSLTRFSERKQSICFVFTANHSPPQKEHSFWSAPRIATSGKVQFSEHARSNHFVFSANQICQTWLWACSEWWEDHESRTSSVGLGQRSWFLVLTKRSAASGDENDSQSDLSTWQEDHDSRTSGVGPA